MSEKSGLKMGWEFFGNQNYAMLHTNRVLPNQSPGDSRTHNQVVILISGIVGVVSAEVDKYTVGIEKGRLFEWAEIQPEIEGRIARFLGAESF